MLRLISFPLRLLQLLSILEFKLKIYYKLLFLLNFIDNSLYIGAKKPQPEQEYAKK